MNGDFLQSDDEEKETRLCANPELAWFIMLAIVAATFCGAVCLAWMEAHP